MTRRFGLYLVAVAAAALTLAIVSDANAFGRRNGGSCGSNGGSGGSWGSNGGSFGSNGGSFGGRRFGRRHGGSWGSNGGSYGGSNGCGSNGGCEEQADCGCEGDDGCESCDTANNGHHDDDAVATEVNGRVRHVTGYRGERTINENRSSREPEIAQREVRGNQNRELRSSERQADRADQSRDQETLRNEPQPQLQAPEQQQQQPTVPSDPSI